MKQHAMQAVIRRKKPKLFHKSEETFKLNVLNRNFHTDSPNKKYVTDISYLPVTNATYYLSAVMDLYNLKIVSFKIGKRPDASLSVDVIKQLAEKVCLKNTIIHSDQGIHYTCNDYTRLLSDNNVIQSMSRRGNCWDNAMIENFFGHFKCECFRLQKRAMRSFEDVNLIIGEYIDFYNNERLHSSLGYVAPNEYQKGTDSAESEV